MLPSQSTQSLSAFLPPPLPNSLALLPRLSPACSATSVLRPTVSSTTHLPIAPTLCNSPQQCHSSRFASPLFSYSYALFCHTQNAKPFTFRRFRTLCQKHPGWGSHPSNERVRSVPGSFSDRDSPNTNHNSHPLLVTRHSPPVAASALLPPPVTGHQSQVTKSFTIRTYRKCPYNSFRIRTSKTRHLKPFRMNTYRKTGEGEGLIWRQFGQLERFQIRSHDVGDAADFGGGSEFVNRGFLLLATLLEDELIRRP